MFHKPEYQRIVVHLGHLRLRVRWTWTWIALDATNFGWEHQVLSTLAGVERGPLVHVNINLLYKDSIGRGVKKPPLLFKLSMINGTRNGDTVLFTRARH